MELETNRVKNVGHANSREKTAKTSEVPSIRLSPEQIEEIHADEYTLTLFYATRMEALTLLEIKKQFPEPESKKAQSVLERFLKVGLIHINEAGKYYSNYPENYINYSHYRYDNDLEARKDSKVFQIMKDQTGNLPFWKDKTYFSMDAFYSEDQTDELLVLFKKIKSLAKEYSNENAKKKSLKGLKFRRMKFYDLTFCLILLFALSSFFNNSFAGGNDPTDRNKLNMIERSGGGGNDPTGKFSSMENQVEAKDYFKNLIAKSDRELGGGGHDPDDHSRPSCVLIIDNQQIFVKNSKLCKIKSLFDTIDYCEQSSNDNCQYLNEELENFKALIPTIRE